MSLGLGEGDLSFRRPQVVNARRNGPTGWWWQRRMGRTFSHEPLAPLDAGAAKTKLPALGLQNWHGEGQESHSTHNESPFPRLGARSHLSWRTRLRRASAPLLDACTDKRRVCDMPAAHDSADASAVLALLMRPSSARTCYCARRCVAALA